MACEAFLLEGNRVLARIVMHLGEVEERGLHVAERVRLLHHKVEGRLGLMPLLDLHLPRLNANSAISLEFERTAECVGAGRRKSEGGSLDKV